MRISRPLRDWSSWPIGPSTGSALDLRSHPVACMRRTVLGYYQAVPAGLYATNSCRSSGAGEEMHIVPNGCGYDPAMIQQSRRSPENVETRGHGFSRAAQESNG